MGGDVWLRWLLAALTAAVAAAVVLLLPNSSCGGGGSTQRLRWVTGYLHQQRAPHRWEHAGDHAAATDSATLPPLPPGEAPIDHDRWHVEIHVFAWRRTHALRRLFTSLLAVEPPAWPIDAVVHIDGDPAPGVLDLVAGFQWPWGRLTVHASPERRGLEEVH